MKILKKIGILVYLLITITSYAINIENDSLMNSTNFERFYFMNECDACGCSAASASTNLENLLHSNYVGVRYLHQYYKAQESSFSTTKNQKQNFNTILLWTKIPITKNVEISASIPYHVHEKSGETKTNIEGFGDLNLMGIYKIIQKQKAENSNFEHSLSVGLGVKIPLAKFDESSTTTTNPSFQLGTGSWDTQFALNYQINYKKSSIQLLTDYNLKGKNDKNYKFGNQWNQSLQLDQKIYNNELILIGKMGFLNELYDQNKQFGEAIPKTKGDAQFLKFGLEGSLGKYNFGAEYFHALNSNLNSGEIEVKNRIGLFINYRIFDTKKQSI